MHQRPRDPLSQLLGAKPPWEPLRGVGEVTGGPEGPQWGRPSLGSRASFLRVRVRERSQGLLPASPVRLESPEVSVRYTGPPSSSFAWDPCHHRPSPSSTPRTLTPPRSHLNPTPRLPLPAHCSSYNKPGFWSNSLGPSIIPCLQLCEGPFVHPSTGQPWRLPLPLSSHPQSLWGPAFFIWGQPPSPFPVATVLLQRPGSSWSPWSPASPCPSARHRQQGFPL